MPIYTHWQEIERTPYRKTILEVIQNLVTGVPILCNSQAINQNFATITWEEANST